MVREYLIKFSTVFNIFDLTDGELVMAKLQQDDQRVSHGVNLLISILVRYPEIGTINFDAHNSTIKLTFMLSSIPDAPEFNKLRTLLLNSIAAYHILEGSNPVTSDVELSSCEQVAMLTILRDVATLSKGEIALLIVLLRDNLKDRLIADENDAMLEEDLLVQEELIGNMLENIKTQQTGSGLIGIREDGRVLVFNK
ncbi:MAG: hypothetical protein P4N59_19180 [Negativicutes bacterium]|nr:hypothetical protein [Negativicutes bacterium]